MTAPEHDLDVALAALAAGTTTVRAGYGQALRIQAKTGLDFATNVDLEAEHAMLDVITAARPDDAVEGEETGRRGAATASRRWLVDPLCGTVNFAARTPLVAVNVALVDGALTLVAATSDPIAGEVFWTDGVRAALRSADGTDLPLAPSRASRLVDVNCDGPLDRPFVGAQVIDAAFRAAFGPRVGSTTLALAWVAAGRRAGYVSDGAVVDSVHFAAGIALCRAAGCVVTDLSGSELASGRGLIIAADAATHRRLTDLVAPHLAAVTASDRPAAATIHDSRPPRRHHLPNNQA
ncbi:inositol monophosphatase family protein [Nocardioides nitrophenolicus]|uniref:inositol monophosphatase family protein n=1 Tax=Nocardioides nitrophenolicus TaxID=60489 RepID=UPI00195C95A7|nr:inositol monophosphatase family protein [Nocardioides nitrophenolicus]MBM7518147.1 myo-inositol-1(or 4)-monophosphatase [Nocardioides nitrophenolicus]